MKNYHQTAAEVVNIVCDAFDISTKEKFEKKQKVIAEIEGFLIKRAVASQITEQHLTILKQMILGKNAKEIGEAVFLSPRTVEAHIVHIKQIFGARNQAQLIAMAKDYMVI
jgi:DNA-binding CsgD family transcriptional regulator